MAIGVVENIQSSFDYVNKMFTSFTDWIIVITISLVTLFGGLMILLGTFGLVFSAIGLSELTSAVPVPEVIGAFALLFIAVGVVLSFASLFLEGIVVRVYRGSEVKLENWGKMFIDGLLYTIIVLIYMIPYIILSIAVEFGPTDNPGYLIGTQILLLLLLIVTMMLTLMGVVRFAREERVTAAFQFKEIFSIIGNIGWLRYLASLILFEIILTVIAVVLLLLIGVGWVLLAILSPLFLFWQAKFVANLYENGCAAEITE